MMHGSTVTYKSVSWRIEGGCLSRIWLRATNSAWRVPCGRVCQMILALDGEYVRLSE